MEKLRLLAIIEQEIYYAEKRLDDREHKNLQSATAAGDLMPGPRDLKKIEYSLADMHEVRRVVMNHMLSDRFHENVPTSIIPAPVHDPAGARYAWSTQGTASVCGSLR